MTLAGIAVRCQHDNSIIIEIPRKVSWQVNKRQKKKPDSWRSDARLVSPRLGTMPKSFYFHLKRVFDHSQQEPAVWGRIEQLLPSSHRRRRPIESETEA